MVTFLRIYFLSISHSLILYHGVVEGMGKDKNIEYEVVVEEVMEEKYEDEDAIVGELALMALGNSNFQEGLSKKILPNLLCIFNSRLWNL